MTPRISQQTFPAGSQRSTLEPVTDVQVFHALHRVLSVCMPLFARAMDSLTKGSSVGMFRDGPPLP
ncbi:MAG TPA: hypothetical protein VKF36_00170 [Syntrophorhabdales bacterium]|nr:hypothetical protein [Syntrophorhabdales bacterium]